MRQRAGGVPPLSYCLRRRCAAAPPCSGAGEPTPVRANLQSWVRWPDGHTFFAFLYTTGPARQRDMGAASRCSPPCAKGGQHGAAMQGGLTALSYMDDTSRRVWAWSARCPQSLSRRSPTAPFAQGSRLCCLAPNQPGFCCRARQRNMTAEALRGGKIYE